LSISFPGPTLEASCSDVPPNHVRNSVELAEGLVAHPAVADDFPAYEFEIAEIGKLLFPILG